MLEKIKIILNKKQRFYFVILFFGIFVSTMLELVGIGSVPIFVGFLLNPEVLSSHLPSSDLTIFFINQDHFYKVTLISIILILFFVLKNLFIILVTIFQASMFRNLNVENAKRLFKAYVNTPYHLHLNFNPAIITRNVLVETITSSVFIDSLMTLVRDFLIIAGIFILLLAVDFKTSSVVFVIMGLFTTIFYKLIKKRMTYFAKISQNHRGQSFKIINQVFNAIKETKILSKELFFTDQFVIEKKGSERATFFHQVIKKIPRPVMETLAVITILLITIIFFINDRPVNDILPTLSLMGIAVIRLIPSFNSITVTAAYLKETQVSFDVVASQLNKFEKNANKKYLKEIKSDFKNEEIKLINVSYKYPNSENLVLKNINLNIKSKSSVAFVGTTGSGKTTLVDLISGLLQPTNGEIVSSNININDNPIAWQSKIGYIPQDIYLIDDTIKRNIAFGIGDDNINEEAIIRSTKLAQINKFISDLPLGFDTVVGNRGIRLSGGQRQRIGIARALYHDPAILILDEATSSLDYATEKKLIEDIESLHGKYTIIIISHRLLITKNCDQVFKKMRKLILSNRIKQNLETRIREDGFKRLT